MDSSCKYTMPLAKVATLPKESPSSCLRVSLMIKNYQNHFKIKKWGREDFHAVTI